MQARYEKGRPLCTECNEVLRYWLTAQGETAVTSKKRQGSYYVDGFWMWSDIELRRDTPAHWSIADTEVYPRYSVLPELRRNGMRGRLPKAHPMRLMKGLLTDHRIETMMKSKADKALTYFLYNTHNLDRYWASYKVAMRRGYEIKDYGIWCDMLGLLNRCGRDIRNPKYICPKDLQAEHDPG